jgi:hypothetical protein
VDEDDFDLAGFDEAYSPDDFTQQEMDFASAIGAQTGGFGDDNTAQVIANQLAQPQVGLNRSNITNLVDARTGQSLYDPTFAAALDISRGLDPTNNMGGTGGLAVPSYLRPQIESGRVDARGEPIRYSSGFERFLQEDVTDFVQSGPGIVGLIGNFLSDNFNDAKKALGLDGGAKGGLKTEDLQPDKFISGMSQQGAGMSVTDPVVPAPATVNMASVPQVSPMFDQFGNPYRSRFMRDAAEMAQQSLSGGIASVAPTMAREVGDAMKDTFVTTTPNLNLPGFRSKSMSKEEADRVKENLEKNNPVYQQMSDASQFLNPQAISRGLNYFAGPQIQDFFRGVTNNPNTTIRLGPGFDMEKQKVDDNIFSINIPFATG